MDDIQSTAPTSASDIASLLEEIHALRDDFDAKIKYDEHQGRLIDTLHAELQIYREGMHFRIIRPICIDLIAMHDDLSTLIDTLSAEQSDQAASSPEQSIKNLRLFQITLEEILRRNGVEAFSVEGSQFVQQQQRALTVVATEDATQDRQIARRVRKGFRYDDRVLRPELVDVYRLSSN